MLILGTREFIIKKGVVGSIFYCEACGLESRWELVRVWTWFTLFFLPVFPIWLKTVIRCPGCECGIKIRWKDREEMIKYFHEDQVSQVQAESLREAIGQENERREEAISSSADIYRDKPAVAEITLGSFKGAPANDERTFDFVDGERILSIEKRALLKRLGINVALALALVFFAFVAEDIHPLFQIFFIMITLYLLFLIPKELVTFHRDRQRMIGSIRVAGNSIWFDDEEVKFYHIQKVYMTDIAMNTRSAFTAAQRYLNLYTDTERKKVWLGSQSSVNHEEYLALCEFLEYSFHQKQIAFYYSKKRPIFE